MVHPSPSQTELLHPSFAQLAITLSRARSAERDAECAMRSAREALHRARKFTATVIEQIEHASEQEAQMMLDLEAGEQQGRARCAGCRNRLSLRQGPHSRDPRAWAEVPKPSGNGTLYYCRTCADSLYRTGSA